MIPQLSPKEHVGDMMRRKLGNLHQPIRTFKVLRREVQVDWDTILQEELDLLTESMQRPIGECLENLERQTPY